VQRAQSLQAGGGGATRKLPAMNSDPAEHSGGGEELSMGVDASNALREKLGLKPLREGASLKEKEIQSRQKEAQDERQRAEREVEVEARLEKMRNKRLLRTELQGASVAEKLQQGGEKAATAGFADWVSHSRGLDKERELAKKREAELEAQDKAAEYTGADVAGMTVAHDVGDMRDGESIIMTLKDSSILHEENGDVSMNDEADAMENVNMAEADRTKQRLDTKKKKAFARYQDALAGEESGAMDGGAVLPHYDDIDPVTGEARKQAASTASFTLGEQGAEQDAKRAKLEAIKAKLAKGTGGVRTGAAAQSVDVSMQKTAATDFYSATEMTQFAKPKEKKRRKVRKKKKKKSSLADELEPLEDQGAEDRGSRKDAAKARRDAEQDAKAAATKSRGWENAAAKAEELARHVAGDSDHDGDSAAMILDEEEDAEMQKALARARRLTSKNESSQSLGLASVKAQVEATKAKDELSASAGGDDGGEDLEFTVTGEFCKAISTDHLRKKRKAEDDDLDQDSDEDSDEDGEEGAAAAAAAAAASGESGTRATGGWTSDKAEKKPKADDDDENENQQDLDGALEAEPMAAKGMAAALALARSKGMLRDAEEQKLFGRSNDMKGQRTQEADEKKLQAKLREETEKEAAKSGRGRDDERRRSDRDSDSSRGGDRRGRDERDAGHTSGRPAASMGPPPVARPRQGNLDDVARIDELMKAKAATRQILYADENGRKLSTKQAFRQLAHQFHGITPGKKKIEKQMRLEAEEQKMHEMSVVDTPLNSSTALHKEQERSGKAFINLDAKKVSEKEMKRLKKRAARAAEKAAKANA
jgi:U4/U6.U5 tri-snRNP-associated protein 1